MSRAMRAIPTDRAMTKRPPKAAGAWMSTNRAGKESARMCNQVNTICKLRGNEQDETDGRGCEENGSVKCSIASCAQVC